MTEKTKKEFRLVCTGLTEQEYKQQRYSGDNGDRDKKTCYLCKRREGENSMLLLPEGEKQSLITSPVDLISVEVDLEEEGRKVVFEFPVCKECAVLFGAYPAKSQK